MARMLDHLDAHQPDAAREGQAELILRLCQLAEYDYRALGVGLAQLRHPAMSPPELAKLLGLGRDRVHILLKRARAFLPGLERLLDTTKSRAQSERRRREGRRP